MFLVRMIYVSQYVPEMSEADLGNILDTARQNNEKHDLTGLMVYDGRFFLQVIEGSRSAVSRLMGNLFHDPRHKQIEVLEFDAVEQRTFGDWSMQCVPANAITKKMVMQYSASSEFDPYRLTKGSVLAFLKELSELKF